MILNLQRGIILYTILDFLSAIGLTNDMAYFEQLCPDW